MMSLSASINIAGWTVIDKKAKQLGVAGTLQVQRCLTGMVLPLGTHPALLRFNRSGQMLSDSEVDQRLEKQQCMYDAVTEVVVGWNDPEDVDLRRSPVWGYFAVWGVLVMCRGSEGLDILSSMYDGLQKMEDVFTMNGETWLRANYLTQLRYGFQIPMGWHKQPKFHKLFKETYKQVCLCWFVLSTASISMLSHCDVKCR